MLSLVVVTCCCHLLSSLAVVTNEVAVAAMGCGGIGAKWRNFELLIVILENEHISTSIFDKDGYLTFSDYQE